jgi:hypothetical protein
MGSFWGPVDKANLERVGPWADIVAGTDGADTDVNALVAAGHVRIILGHGSVLTASLTISASNGFLWSPRNYRSLTLGAYPLVIDGSFFHLEGFQIAGATGVGITLSTNANSITIQRVGSVSNTSHGIEIANTFDNDSIENCWIISNGGDGIRVGAGAANARIVGNTITTNTGYGVNDLDDSTILVSNKLTGNVAGAINGTPDVNVGNLT